MKSFEEIELKLEIAPDVVEALANMPELADARPRRRDQLSVYFDTAGQDLRDAGLSLRVRHVDATRIQTVKAESPAAAGLFAREEWEQLIEGDEPVLDGAEDGLARMLAHTDLEGLRPAFRSKVERTIWNVAFGDARIELVLDRGEMTAETRTEPVSEIEMELRAGGAADLFGFARALAAQVPLRLGVLTKSERGYRLLDDKAERAEKAQPVLLSDDMTAAEAFQAIARSCLRQYRLNETLLLANRAGQPLHQARVALRRLRSALSIFRPMLADERFDHFRAELRWLASEFGDARNLDVLLDRADGTPHVEMLRAARERAYDTACAALSSLRCMTLLLDFTEWVAIGPWLGMPATEKLRRRSAEDFADDLLNRYRKRIKRKGKDLAAIDDEPRHQVRIEAKKLRYAAEFFAPLYEGKSAVRRRKAFLEALEDLQGHLGDLNDHATGQEVLAHLGLPEAVATELLDTSIDRLALLAKAEDAFEELMDAKPFWR